MEIVPFRPELAPAFESLNRAWIERFFKIEQSDLDVLVDPEAAIIRPGGQVFFALDGSTPIGTVAAVRESAARFELAKMAVTPGCQGRGIGRLLATAVIDWSRAQGGEVVFLLSSSRLGPALRLYESLGFRHRPLPAVTGYERADVYMELDLGRGPAGTD